MIPRPRRVRVLNLILIGLLGCIDSIASAAPAATAPSKPATTAPAVAVQQVPALLEEGIADLNQGQTDAALIVLHQAESAYGKWARVSSLQQADVMHALGVAYARSGNPQRARLYLERIYALRKSDRTFLLNHARLEIPSRNLAAGAARDLDAYLATCNPPDEQALNLFGAALNKMAEISTNRGLVQKLGSNYEVYNGRLEQTRPGERRWGTEWISQDKFNSIDSQRTDAQHQIDEAAKRLNEARYALQRQQAAYEQAQANAIYHGGRASMQQLDTSGAQHRIAQAEADLHTAQDRMPRPNWVVDLTLSVPAFQQYDEPTNISASPARPKSQ